MNKFDCLFYEMMNGIVNMHDELEKMWKEAGMAYLRTSSSLLRGTGEYHRTPVQIVSLQVEI
jgi:hypothetical protein